MKQKEIKSAAQGSSYTALLVVEAAYNLSRKSNYGLFLDEEDCIAANHIIKTAIEAETNRFLWFMETTIPKLPKLVREPFLNTFAAQGYVELMLSRKLLIRNHIRNAIAEGVKQVIILAGGYDPRAFMESLRYKSVNFFELDRAQTRKNKLKGLLTLPKIPPIENIHHQQHDDGTLQINDNLWLMEYDADVDNLKDVLSRHGFQKEKKTLVIAEGLLVYLNESSIQSLLHSIYDLIDEGNEFFLSFNNSTYASFLGKYIIKSTSELYLSAKTPEQVLTLAAASGFDIIALIKHQDRLEFIGDHENAKVYQENKAGHVDEIYYRFVKSSDILKNGPHKAVSDIPIMDMSLKTNDVS